MRCTFPLRFKWIVCLVRFSSLQRCTMSFMAEQRANISCRFLSTNERFSVSEPRINSSDDVALLPGSHPPPSTLQCNLTNSHNTHRQSFWMKNGEEIPGTRRDLKNTEYRYGSRFLTRCNRFSGRRSLWWWRTGYLSVGGSSPTADLSRKVLCWSDKNTQLSKLGKFRMKLSARRWIFEGFPPGWKNTALHFFFNKLWFSDTNNEGKPQKPAAN